MASRWSVLKWKEIWEFMVSMAAESSSWMHTLYIRLVILYADTNWPCQKIILPTRMNWFVVTSAGEGIFFFFRSVWKVELLGFRKRDHRYGYVSNVQASRMLPQQRFFFCSMSVVAVSFDFPVEFAWINSKLYRISTLETDRKFVQIEGIEFHL